MDFSLLNICFALFACELALYFWEEPKVRDLERLRREKIVEAVGKLVIELGPRKQINSLKEELSEFIYTAYDNDKYLVMPVISLLPHRKIFILLAVAFTTSIAWGFMVNSASSTINPLVAQNNLFQLNLSHLFAVIAIICMSIASFYGYNEFRYVIQITKKFDGKID